MEGRLDQLNSHVRIYLGYLGYKVRSPTRNNSNRLRNGFESQLYYFLNKSNKTRRISRTNFGENYRGSKRPDNFQNMYHPTPIRWNKFMLVKCLENCYLSIQEKLNFSLKYLIIQSTYLWIRGRRLVKAVTSTILRWCITRIWIRFRSSFISPRCFTTQATLTMFSPERTGTKNSRHSCSY